MARTTKEKDNLFIIVAGDPFYKKLRWKDKYKEPILLTGFDFRAVFIYNFGEDNILTELTVENSGVIVNESAGELTLYIPSLITSTLKSYDEGLWRLEYATSVNPEFKKLIGGRWSVEPDMKK